jgi:hypothetical protein
MTCISIQTWAAYLIGAALALGVLIGSFIRLGIDRAELAAYHRIARRLPDDWRVK